MQEAVVEKTGTHGLCCKKSGGRIPRHHSANKTIRRTLISGGVPSILEPAGVCREDGKRPGGMTLIPRESGQYLLWDFTCSDTLAPLKVERASRGTADAVKESKRSKYTSLITMFLFSPVCIEPLGAWGASVRSLVCKIGLRIHEATGGIRATTFQRLAINILRGSGISVMAIIPSSWEQIGFSFVKLLCHIVKLFDCCISWVVIYGVPFVPKVIRLMQPKQPADLLNRTTDLLNSFSDLLNRTADLLNRTADLLNRTVDLLYRTADLQNRSADLLNQAVDMLNPLLDLLNQAADLLNPLYNLLNLCCALDYPYSSFDHTSLIG